MQTTVGTRRFLDKRHGDDTLLWACQFIGLFEDMEAKADTRTSKQALKEWLDTMPELSMKRSLAETRRSAMVAFVEGTCETFEGMLKARVAEKKVARGLKCTPG